MADPNVPRKPATMNLPTTSGPVNDNWWATVKPHGTFVDPMFDMKRDIKTLDYMMRGNNYENFLKGPRREELMNLDDSEGAQSLQDAMRMRMQLPR